MKKIFLFLFLVYSYSFGAWQVVPNPFSGGLPSCASVSSQQSYNDTGKWLLSSSNQYNSNYYSPSGILYSISTTQCLGTPPPCSFESSETGDGLLLCSNGNYQLVPNPDPNGGDRCNDLFVKDGVAYTCNPNTNEATPIPNSNGLAYDPESDDYVPNCNDGYEHTSTPTLVVGGTGSSYTSWGCAPVTGTGDTGTGSTGDGSDTGGDTGVGGSTGTGTGDTSTGDTGSTGGSGSTTGTGDTSTGGSGGSGGSVSGGGSTGGTGGTGDTGTTNPDSTDTTTPPATDNPDTGDNDNTTTTPPTDNTDTDNGDTTTPPTDGSNDGTGDNTDTTNGADSCNDPNLTLQEKMLCQLSNNNGELGAKIDITNSKLTTSNTYLKSIDTSLGSMNSNLSSINNNLEDNQGKSYLETISDFFKTASELVSNPSKIQDSINSKLTEVTNKYSADIINDNSCGSISPISINYHGSNVVLLSQSLLDEYFPIAIMKTIIILTFAFAGFMNFFRSNN